MDQLNFEALSEKYDGLKKSFELAIREGKRLPELATFYSNGCAGLAVGITSGQLTIDSAGNRERVGQRIAEFTPIPNGLKDENGYVKHFGYYATSDPEIALGLLKRALDPRKADVLMPDEYLEMMTPPTERLRQTELRLLTTTNDLQAYLQENADLKRQVAALAAAKSAGKGAAADAK